jgi:putative membrane protein
MAQLPAVAPFTPHWSIHPSVVIGVGLVAAFYLWGIGSVRRRRAFGPPVERWRQLCFFGGLAVLLGSLNGPIHDLSDSYLFWVHMGQHLLLTMVLPPLLVAGVPGWLIERAVGRSGGRAVGQLLTHPVFAGLFFSVVLLVWHTPGAYDLMMRNHRVHVVTHLLFLIAALLLWWPVLSQAPSLPRLSPGLGMLYLFLVQLPMQLLGAIITFADRLLYPWYAAAPRTWGLSPLEDQKLGGLLMWIPGNLWIWGAMSVLFFRWARQEGDQG